MRSYWIYDYDDLGQVISGRRYWSDHTPVAGQQFEYGFDEWASQALPMDSRLRTFALANRSGNRESTKAGGDENGSGLRSATYAANGLNQYTSRTVPGGYDILGAATATSDVKVKG